MKDRGSLRKTWITGIFLLAAMVGLTYFFVLSPRMEEPAQLMATADEAALQQAGLEAQIVKLSDQAAALDQVEQVAKETVRRAPWETDTPGLVIQVEKAAAEAGLPPSQITAIAPGAPVTPGGEGETPPPQEGDGDEAPVSPPAGESSATAVATLDLQITVSGQYEELANFISLLQRGERVIVVSSVRLSAEGTLYRAEIAAYTILLPPPPNRPPVDVPTSTDDSTVPESGGGAGRPERPSAT